MIEPKKPGKRSRKETTAAAARVASAFEKAYEWSQKGATLTNGTAAREYGLTPQEILRALRQGKLQYRRTWIYGNPCVRLLRREVEALVRREHGARKPDTSRRTRRSTS